MAMSPRPGKKLSDEDRVLWSLVAQSAVPLKGRKAVDIPVPAAPKAGAPVPPPPAAGKAASAEPGRQPATPRAVPRHVIDRPTLDKLAKGKVPIEGRVDLHGMSQDEAYFLLHSFLQRAHAGGLRYVLVITGKGSSSGGDGILRRAVPAWLATAPFRLLVSSHENAAQKHGGGGALYVRLKRHGPVR
jgi:DNA-nicking Smr family endonuclease